MKYLYGTYQNVISSMYGYSSSETVMDRIVLQIWRIRVVCSAQTVMEM